MTTRGRILAITTAVGALALAIGASAAPQASLTLRNNDATICYHNNTEWTLTKTVLPTPTLESGQDAVFTVTATRGATSHNIISVDGYIQIENTGTADATIGNVVVNLQRKLENPYNSTWMSAAVDIADATRGDAATFAHILAAATNENASLNNMPDPPVNGPQNYSVEHRTTNGDIGTFNEGNGSGSLTLTDVNGNTSWNLMPQQVIPKGATVTLKYEAAFDNTVLGLVTGQQLKIEFIVSFGNVGPRGGSGASGSLVDISGDGCVDSTNAINCPPIPDVYPGEQGTSDGDEAYIRSVPARVSLSLPPLSSCNDSVTLTDSGPTKLGSVIWGNVINPIAPGQVLTGNAVYTVTVEDVTGEGILCNAAALDGESSTVSLPNPADPMHPITFDCCVGAHYPASACVNVTNPTPTFGPDCGYTTYSKGGYQGGGDNCGSPACQLMRDHYTDVFGPNGLSIGKGGYGNTNGSGFQARWEATVPGRESLKDFLVNKGTSPVTTCPCACNGSGYSYDGATLDCKKGQTHKPVCAPGCTTTQQPGSCGGNTSGVLTADTLNAQCNSSGSLGEQLAALTLTVRFDAAGYLTRTPPTGGGTCVAYSQLVICDNQLDGVLDSAVGQTIAEIIGDANRALAGGGFHQSVADYNASSLNELIEHLNLAYDSGDHTWANNHLCEP